MLSQQTHHSTRLSAVIDNIIEEEATILRLAASLLDPVRIQDQTLVFTLIIKEYLKLYGFSDFQQICQDHSILDKLKTKETLLRAFSEGELLNGQAASAQAAVSTQAAAAESTTFLQRHAKELARQQTVVLSDFPSKPDPSFAQAAETVRRWLEDGTFEKLKKWLMTSRKCLEGKLIDLSSALRKR